MVSKDGVILSTLFHRVESIIGILQEIKAVTKKKKITESKQEK